MIMKQSSRSIIFCFLSIPDSPVGWNSRHPSFYRKYLDQFSWRPRSSPSPSSEEEKRPSPCLDQEIKNSLRSTEFAPIPSPFYLLIISVQIFKSNKLSFRVTSFWRQNDVINTLFDKYELIIWIWRVWKYLSQQYLCMIKPLSWNYTIFEFLNGKFYPNKPYIVGKGI